MLEQLKAYRQYKELKVGQVSEADVGPGSRVRSHMVTLGGN